MIKTNHGRKIFLVTTGIATLLAGCVWLWLNMRSVNEVKASMKYGPAAIVLYGVINIVIGLRLPKEPSDDEDGASEDQPG